MPHAGPSTSARKPTKQKQKQNAKRPKKSVLSRQTVELLDKTALEYVGARFSRALHMTLIEARIRSPQTTSRLSRICQSRTLRRKV